MLTHRRVAAGSVRRQCVGRALYEIVGRGSATMKKSDWRAPALRGFSLLEILVVIGLITFLTGALIVVLPRFSATAKIAATRATISKVDELLNDRINGFIRWQQTQNQMAGNNPPNYVVSAGYTTQYNQNPPLYQLLAAKAAFRTAFPQNFSELTTTPSYNASLHNPVTESAACLYMILTQAAVFDTEPPAAGSLQGVEVADTDHDGLMEVVDAWGQPLRFYRWPTRLFRPFNPKIPNPPTPGVTISTPYWHYLESAPAATPASILVSTAPRAPIYPWSATTVYNAGQYIQPATLPPGDLMMYQCTVTGGATSGTSGSSEPNWSSAMGTGTSPSSGVDGNITWVAVVDPLTIDSDDPNGLASSNLINESSAGTFHTWATYHVPLIVSCGPDGALGLFEPVDAPNYGTLAQPQYDSSGVFVLDALGDDITNHQQGH
jgi:type II secretory pathway pseudopilin PulG